MDWPTHDPTMPDAGGAGGPAGRPAGGRAHAMELALFLAVHYGRAPGVLWPEYDDPAPAADPYAFPLLARRLALLTRLTVAVLPPTAGRGHGHLLVRQLHGSRTWTLTGPPTGPRGGPGAAGAGERRFRYRLRAGELLYVPDRWTRRTGPAADGSQDAALLLSPAAR
ncbi:hypothetical protein [Streptomyces antimicrobicus]|uniref:Uncharacterized protein n=1 Tax=Streptomyces antimicrobicus TaxID=2883108 RepID=A0ABS8B333_9ACTN|nr:hypothetical protein [Streptomyces antimicrobicus]MCB5179015.1 hypothetical protein [Streptomyces antimicrobicus]